MCSWLHYALNAFDASYGTESCVMSFIVNRPVNEPGFYLERQEGPARQIRYTIKSYSVQANPEGGRY
jgi:ribulose-bisphosphate carboxylase small chain